MSTKSVYKAFLVLFTAVILLVPDLLAQRNIGLQWDIPQNTDEALSQLEQFSELGVNILEISELPSDQIWSEIERLDFEIYGAIPIRFPIIQTFAEPDSQLIATIERYANVYLSQSPVSAVRLFEYGQITREEFNEVLVPYVRELKNSRTASVSIYAKTSRLQFVSLPSLDNFLYEIRVNTNNIDQLIIPESTDRISGFYYAPSGKLADLITPFKRTLDATSDQNHLPLFISSGWLLNILERYPSFGQTISRLSTEPDPVFPLPNETIPEAGGATAIPLILLFVWGSFALHYSGSPLYRKSLFRYFTSHNFFVDDIYRRHIRSILPAFIIIFQNALLIAICAYVTFDSLFNALGKEALFYHFKWLSFFGKSLFSIYLLAFSTSIILSFLLILWLYFSNKSLTNMSQAATLYSWPLQINFLVTAILVPLYISGESIFTVTALSLFAAAVFLAAFVFASIDTVRLMRSRKGLFLLGTSGIYITLLLFAVIYLTASDYFIQVILLSLFL